MRKSHLPRLRAELNVTPLVDVALVLLIIFMVVTPMMQKGQAVRLPIARASEREKGRPGSTLVTVDRNAKLFLDKAAVSEEALGRALGSMVRGNPEIDVFIKADKELRYGQVHRVMRTCHEAGAKRISLATREPDKSE